LFLAATVGVYRVLPEKIASTLLSYQPTLSARTPSDEHLAYEAVRIPADGDVVLAGWWLPSAGSSGQPAKGTILLSHGIHRNRDQVLARAAFLARAGWRVLLFDLRGHGESSAAALSGGVNEEKDYVAAFQYLKKTGKDKKPVVLYGVSLSAMAAMRAAAHGRIGEGVIADSPLPNVKNYVSLRTTGGRFLKLPGFLGVLLEVYNKKTGLFLTEKDLDLTFVARELKTPVLYLSGEKDDLVSPGEMGKLFQATRTANRRLIYIPEAKHDQTYEKYPIVYERAVLQFLDNVKNGFPESLARKKRLEAKATQGIPGR